MKRSEALSYPQHLFNQTEDAPPDTSLITSAGTAAEAIPDERESDSFEEEPEVAEGSFGPGLESRIYWELSRLDIPFVGLAVVCEHATCQVRLEYAPDAYDGAEPGSIASKLRSFASTLRDPELGIQHVRVRHDSPAYDTSFVRSTIVLSGDGESMSQFYEDLATGADESAN